MSQYLFLADGGVAYAFFHTDAIGQIICVALLIFSVAVWIVMTEKIITLNHIRKDTLRFAKLFAEKRNPLHFKDRIEEEPGPAARVFQAACVKIDAFHIEGPAGGRRALTDDELSLVRDAMSQEVEKQILLFEKGTMFLATAVSACPFLGLFGTVWGIMAAFTNLAILGHANIQTLAPGVSGALLTTVVALLVAIPSLVGTNMISAKIRNLEVCLDDFAEEAASRLKIEQMESLQAARRENT